MNQSLKQKVEKFAKADQEKRRKWIKDPKKENFKSVLAQDKKSIDFVKSVLKEYGWPKYKTVGKRASDKFWLLVQHADTNINLQKKALKLLEKEVNCNQASRKNLIYLIDRVLINEKKKQIYGTQFLIKNGKIHLHPVKNARKLNNLRKEMGLEKIETTKIKIEKKYKSLMKKNKIAT